MKLRLLLFEECNRRCSGCCNKSWDLSSLPVCTHFGGYSEIMLTGGEPMLYPELVKQVCRRIWADTKAPVYMYTAKTDNPLALMDVLSYLDGLCVTLHGQKDVAPFVEFQKRLLKREWLCAVRPSLRLNVFKGVTMRGVDTTGWEVKRVRWIKDCPLPADEVFMRLNPA